MIRRTQTLHRDRRRARRALIWIEATRPDESVEQIYVRSPERALRVVRQVCRFTVAGVWFYQGLVPKLLGPHSDELALAAAFGIPGDSQPLASYTAGAVELVIGLLVLALPRYAWPQVLSAAVTFVLLLFVCFYAPSYLSAAFNPVVMNCASIALSAIAVLALRGAHHDAGFIPESRTTLPRR